MFAFLICMLTLQQVHSACNVQGACPENDATLQTEIVDVHNAFRRGVQPTASDMLSMSYDEEVAASTQAYVENCNEGHGAPSSRVLNGYELGENLFFSEEPSSWTAVITAWHNEVSHYQYPSGSADGGPVGHYTQVVWNSCYKVGCGVTLCSNTTYIYGCRYFRSGNFNAWRPYKEGASCASCPNDCEDKLCTNPCPYIDGYSNCPTMKVTPGCSNSQVAAVCPASCQCPTEIIPIG